MELWQCWRTCGGWIGPGTVVLVAPNGGSIWVSMRGHLLKCSSEQVRLGTDEEHIGAEVVKMLSQDALIHMRRARQRGFIDVQDILDTNKAIKTARATAAEVMRIPKLDRGARWALVQHRAWTGRRHFMGMGDEEGKIVFRQRRLTDDAPLAHQAAVPA